MDLTIQEASFSVGVNYQIHSERGLWTAHRKMLAVKAHIEVKTETGALIADIQSESLIFNEFGIHLADQNTTFEFHTEKLWKGVDICDGPGGPYRLYRHKGVQYSIFQEDR